MRTRVEAMLQAVRMVRPALEAFFQSLTDEQKQRFNAIQQNTEATPGTSRRHLHCSVAGDDPDRGTAAAGVGTIDRPSHRRRA